MKIAIKYPQDSYAKKMAVSRLMKKNDMEKVVGIADVTLEVVELLRSNGAEVIELSNNSKWTDDDINFFMVFFQRNKNNLHITKIDREFFQNIIKRAKGGK